MTIAARHAESSLDARLEAVRREATTFTGREALEDDCTLLALRRPR